MSAERFRQHSAILAERLTVPTVVLAFHHVEEPLELLKRGCEPRMVMEHHARRPRSLLVRGEEEGDPAVRRLTMRVDRRLDGGDCGPEVRKRVLFEQDQRVAPALEPVDEFVKRRRR